MCNPDETVFCRWSFVDPPFGLGQERYEDRALSTGRDMSSGSLEYSETIRRRMASVPGDGRRVKSTQVRACSATRKSAQRYIMWNLWEREGATISQPPSAGTTTDLEVWYLLKVGLVDHLVAGCKKSKEGREVVWVAGGDRCFHPISSSAHARILPWMSGEEIWAELPAGSRRRRRS